ncbi:hypothetical protein M514_10330 [Trichuris suis]|uniref:Uncharacterized protein n=1 Tax=Trichuris suis TaxID=68888 RepID=A0A085LUX9_9BILA|nr:hypothetical protein M513_10330 [Trichuris suis]KFD69325.1 hypothetical protein M514_10330 [Trichuris suis]
MTIADFPFNSQLRWAQMDVEVDDRSALLELRMMANSVLSNIVTFRMRPDLHDQRRSLTMFSKT